MLDTHSTEYTLQAFDLYIQSFQTTTHNDDDEMVQCTKTSEHDLRAIIISYHIICTDNKLHQRWWTPQRWECVMRGMKTFFGYVKQSRISLSPKCLVCSEIHVMRQKKFIAYLTMLISIYGKVYSVFMKLRGCCVTSISASKALVYCADYVAIL